MAEQDGPELHFLVNDLAAELVSARGTWAPNLSPEQDERLLARMAAANAEGTLEGAVLALFRFAALLEREGAPSRLVSDILRLLDRVVAKYQLTAKTSGPAVSVERSSRLAAERAIGGGVRRRAPLVGERPPTTSVRLDRLAPARVLQRTV